MGLRSSRLVRRQEMGDSRAQRQSRRGRTSPRPSPRSSTSHAGDEAEPDVEHTRLQLNASPGILSTIVSHLTSRVRVGSQYVSYSDETDVFYDQTVNYRQLGPTRPSKFYLLGGDTNSDTTVIDENDLKTIVMQQTGRLKGNSCYRKPILQLLRNRECRKEGFSQGDRCAIGINFLPNRMQVVGQYSQKVFCGTYCQQGDMFVTACQDRFIRIYRTDKDMFHRVKTIHARDVGWSILDTCVSPDGNYLIYSSWSNYLHLCSIFSEHMTHDALQLFPRLDSSFCVFSLKFSADNREILCGANDGDLYVYDREKHVRSLRIAAHDDDVNAVAFADDTSQTLFSGGDDGLCKVWDRRTLSEENPQPVGVFAGHMDGITFIDSKGDSRYLITNSKDQTIKLWDLRHFSSITAQSETRREVMRQKWDYRWQPAPKKVLANRRLLSGDSSVMTYRGHSVLHTLIRARFSPPHSTGQSYIYTGGATGYITVYDVLTGEIVTRLAGHMSCVRDVCWHPYEAKIVSTSWDGALGLWTYCPPRHASCESDNDRADSTSSDSDSDEAPPRRGCGRRTASKRRTRTDGLHPRTAAR